MRKDNEERGLNALAVFGYVVLYLLLTAVCVWFDSIS